MIIISKVIAEQVEEYYRLYYNNGRECRLIVPGLTEKVAEQIHKLLRDKKIKSYLIDGTSPSNQQEERIKPVNLTAKRFGSFIAVVYPGQLASIHDSVRGAGGATRSEAYNEEWPWVDKGCEAFNFNDVIVEKLCSTWEIYGEDKKWIEKFITSGLVKHTAASSNRAKLFFEDLLGNYFPDDYSELTNPIEKFLFHCGVPKSENGYGDVIKYMGRVVKVSEAILELCASENDLRDTIKARIIEKYTDIDKQNILINAIDDFFDGIGVNDAKTIGLLAFYSCWGIFGKKVDNWINLTIDVIEKIFDISDKYEIESAFSIECDKGITNSSSGEIVRGKLFLATFYDEEFIINASIKISESSFHDKEWKILIKNRSKIIEEQIISESDISIPFAIDTNDFNNYRKNLLLKAIILCNGNEVEARSIVVSLCGEQRPAFVVVEPQYKVIDGNTEDIDINTSIIVDGRVQMRIFAHNPNTNVDIKDQDDNESLTVVRDNNANIWRLDEPITPTDIPTIVNLECDYGNNYKSLLSLELKDVEKGEFTLEDELRVNLVKNVKKANTVLPLFSGMSNEPYLFLGKMNDASRRRTFFSNRMTQNDGWKPIITDLCRFYGNESYEIKDLDKYFLYTTNAIIEGLFNITLNRDAEDLLSIYEFRRTKVIDYVSNNIIPNSKNDHPTYAANPVFVSKTADLAEVLLNEYLSAYIDLLSYLRENQSMLEWYEITLLTSLDSVIYRNSSDMSNFFTLLGPWHPLVIAKRYMVQRSIYERATRNKDEIDEFRELISLVEGVSGFRWILGLSSNGGIGPMYVSATSDPGWHIAVRHNIMELVATQGGLDINEIFDIIKNTLDIEVKFPFTGSSTGVPLIINNYIRAYPSRRAVRISMKDGFDLSNVLELINSINHDGEEISDFGKLISGGISILSNNSVGENDSITSDPPVRVYKYNDNTIQEKNVDIHMASPCQDFNFDTREIPFSRLPRGKDKEAVFCEPCFILSMGSTKIPSLMNEVDRNDLMPNDELNSIGTWFLKAICGNIFNPTNHPKLVKYLNVPGKLFSSWTVVQGNEIDPALFVKYVEGGRQYNQDRALWDYKVDIGKKKESYYILSTIPHGFIVAINGAFGDSNYATGFIQSLGKLGIAIGGEALKSGKSARGIIGLVGAARMVENAAISNLDKKIFSFIIPVDSFSAFFGTHNNSENLEKGKRRCDLLAIKIMLTPDEKLVKITSCGIEAKYVSGTFSKEKATEHIEQAMNTNRIFKQLISIGLKKGSIPERLALTQIIKFGLRMIAPTRPHTAWIKCETRIIELILRGNYVYCNSSCMSLIISTEMNLIGDAVYEQNFYNDCDWVRINRNNWPGINDTIRVQEIKNSITSRILVLEDPQIFDGNQNNNHYYNDVGIEGTPEEIKSQPDIIIEENTGDNGGNVNSTSNNTFEDQTSLCNTEYDESHYSNSHLHKPLEKVLVGANYSRKRIYYDPQSTTNPLDNTNLMITGNPGTGKTQLLKYLICKLREQEKNVLILDFKNDYASDKHFSEITGFKKIYVSIDGLPYNPLIPYPMTHPDTGERYIHIGQFIAGLTNVFKRTYNLGAQQQVALKKAIIGAFSDNSIKTEGIIAYNPNLTYPDFNDVGQKLEEINPAAYNRIETLFSLDLFRNEHKKASFESLTKGSFILDFSQIQSEEIRNALAQIIILSAHAYYNSQKHSGIIRQVLVVDEAHRVLKSEYILGLIRECRAYGFSVIMSSQFPSDYNADIAAQIATKIVLSNGSSVDKVKGIVQLLGCEGREQDVSNLGKFEAFISNKHYNNEITRVMNYPLYLLWKYLVQNDGIQKENIGNVNGLDFSMLSLNYLLNMLSKYGLIEEQNDKIKVLYKD